MLQSQKLEHQNYETFNKAYLKSKQLVTEGVSIDEMSSNNGKKFSILLHHLVFIYLKSFLPFKFSITKTMLSNKRLH